ncbi:MAG: TerB family tellurite resistance protein [Hyphomonadaceae bacterium]|nr:TerB family tellurite resistance protein [Hyphomonadaceae bacterium]
MPSAAALTPVDPASGNGTAFALILLLALVAMWFVARAIVRRIQASSADAVVHGDYDVFVIEALANAAKLDGRITAVERDVIVKSIRDACGHDASPAHVDDAIGRAALTKDALVAYLEQHSGAFSQAQKVGFLKALLSVLLADGRFDETEHHALIDYTAAIGFDRQSAPERLRGLIKDMARDRIT